MSRLTLLMLALFASAAQSHTMNSASWRLTQLDARTWDSRLRLPEDFEGRLLSLQPEWPAECRRVDELLRQPAEDGVALRWTLDCPPSLRGQFDLSGFSIQLPDAVLRVEPLHAAPQYAVLSATRPSWEFGVLQAPPPVTHYLALGVEHILLGPDHLMFVLGLWLLWRRSGRGLAMLVGTLTAFTAAHSLTLGGAMLAGWHLPSGAVEACIAASILLLAVELASGARGWAERQPAAVAFSFGLLHGFGFAGALADIGLPEHARLWALAAFNLGVEAGQLLFVCALMLLPLRAAPLRRWAPTALTLYGGVAAYWLLGRSAAVLA